jgi:hypothetical protein
MPAWAALLGAYIADGSANARSIRFGNCPGHKRSIFTKIAKDAGFNAKMYGKDLYINSLELVTYMKSFGHAYQKYVPQYIKDGSKETILAFLHGYGSGDGTTKGAMVYTTVSTRLADDLQELILKSGGYGSVKVRDRRAETHYINGVMFKGNYPEINVTHNKPRVKALLCPEFFESVPYSGKVYCATVPSHVMYVRRNGKASWQGNSGEMGTQGLWVDHCGLYDETLKKAAKLMRGTGYHGYLDLNCIATKEAVYPLEWTPRFGVPTIWLQMEGIKSKLGDFFAAIGEGNRFNLDTESGTQICVVVAVNPFPFEDPKAFDKYSKDKEVEFEDPDIGGIYLCDIKLVDGKYVLAGNSGYACVCVGKGQTMQEAKDEVYKRVKTIHLPDMFYRTDIGHRWHKDRDLLQSWGYL